MKADSLYSPFCLSIVFILQSTLTELSQSRDDSSEYDRCAPFVCGNITFTFPFSNTSTFGSGARHCGLPGYRIFCDESSAIGPRIEIADRLYQVKSIFSSENLIIVVDRELIDQLYDGSCDSLRNLSFPYSDTPPITLPVGVTNLSFFKCNLGSDLTGDFLARVTNYSCSMENHFNIFIGNHNQRPSIVDPPSGCSLVSVPVSGSNATLVRYYFYDLFAWN